MPKFEHSTLFREAELICKNFSSVNDQLSETYQAAELINGLFRDIIYEEFAYQDPEPWQQASVLLTFGASQSWVMAYINSSAGLIDISKMILRRAIEFVCYLSKACQSNERAELWFKRSESLANKKEFTNIYNVPNCYFTDKYSHLRPLLVLHDQVSEVSVHANYETLLSKFTKDDTDHIDTISLHDVNDNKLASTDLILITGYKILGSALSTVIENLGNQSRINTTFTSLRDKVRKARVSLAELDYTGNIPQATLDDINNDTGEGLKQSFDSLIARYHRRDKTGVV
ncbi:MAG: hypothetical protein WD491_10020 [Balneolales bacterium]